MAAEPATAASPGSRLPGTADSDAVGISAPSPLPSPLFCAAISSLLVYPAAANPACGTADHRLLVEHPILWPCPVLNPVGGPFGPVGGPFGGSLARGQNSARKQPTDRPGPVAVARTEHEN